MTLVPEPESPRPEHTYGAFGEAQEEFGELPHVTETDFDDRLLAAHHDLLEDAGHEAVGEFLDRVKRLYTNNAGTATNFRKAALRALEAFEQASDLRSAADVRAFLEGQISEAHIAETHARRPAQFRRAVDGIKRAVARRREIYGSDYKGVIGAVLHGSYADGTFMPDSSDIDMIIITETADPGMELEQEDERWLDYHQDALQAISAQTNRPVDGPIEMPLTAAPRLRGLTRYPLSILYESNMLVVAPDTATEQRIERLLGQGQREAASTRQEAGVETDIIRPLGTITLSSTLNNGQ